MPSAANAEAIERAEGSRADLLKAARMLQKAHGHWEGRLKSAVSRAAVALRMSRAALAQLGGAVEGLGGLGAEAEAGGIGERTREGAGEASAGRNGSFGSQGPALVPSPARGADGQGAAVLGGRSRLDRSVQDLRSAIEANEGFSSGEGPARALRLAAGTGHAV